MDPDDPVQTIAYAWRCSLDDAAEADRERDRQRALARAQAFVEAARALRPLLTATDVVNLLARLSVVPRHRLRKD